MLYLTAPVVITSETHQAPGNVYSQQTTMITTSSVPQSPPQMPMPYPGGGFQPYPQTQPVQP